MNPPTVPTRLEALKCLIGVRRIAANFAKARPCGCNAGVSIRAARAAQGEQGLNAETNSRNLLQEWLSLEQLAQFEGKAHFEVVGSKSEKRYRFHVGPLRNVYELDGDGHLVRGWCFMPERSLALPTGDIMLAQKIALETDEESTTESGCRSAQRWRLAGSEVGWPRSGGVTKAGPWPA
jgi:hypothetical protein